MTAESIHASPVRLLLVDAHELFRRGVAALLAGQDGWTLVGQAADGRNAVRLAEELEPDIVVMDIGIPELDGFETTRAIHRKRPGTEVLILTMHESEHLVRQSIAAGARGYVLKSEASQQLVTAIEMLALHVPYFRSPVAARVFGESRVPKSPRPARRQTGRLTKREREVLQLLAEGRPKGEVASVLGITVKTAESHRARMMRKLGVDSLPELMRRALQPEVAAA